MYVREILQEDTRGVLGRLRYHLSSPFKILRRSYPLLYIVFMCFSNLYMTYYFCIYVRTIYLLCSD